MTKPVMKLLESLPHTWRGVLAVISILGAGLTTGWGAKTLFGQAGELPARVTKLEHDRVDPRRVDDLEAVVRRHDAEIDTIRGDYRETTKLLERVLCYSEYQAGIRPVSECIR